MESHGDDWGWVLRGGMEVCGCLIFARHASPEQMIAAFGLDPGTARLLPPERAGEAVGYPVSGYGKARVTAPVVCAGRSGEWAFAIDEFILSNELAVKGHRVPLHLPAGTETAVVTWTPTISTAEYWADGQQRAFFDLDLDDPELFLGQAGLDVDIAGQVDFNTPESHVAALRMLTLALGVLVPAEAADGPLLYCQRPPEPAGPAPGAAPGTAAGQRPSRGIAEARASTTPPASAPAVSGTASGNLEWLADSALARAQAGFCLTLARGVTEDEMFAAFGADPGQARPRRWEDLQDVMHVQVGRSGDWVFALELNSVNGARPRVLRQASAGGDALTVRGTGTGVHHKFAYATGGDLIAAVDTLTLGNWEGSDPGRLRRLAEESGLTLPRPPDAPDRLRAVLAMAERTCGARLAPADLDRALPSAELPPAPLEELRFCLTFVQGACEEEVFTALGADPRDAVPLRRRELEHGMFLQVGRSGDWLFALESISDNGIKAKALRRLSAGGRAVTVRFDPGGQDADFGYAENSDLVARVNTHSPHRWTGSDPDRFRELAQESGLTGTTRMPGPDAVRSVLSLAERVVGAPVEDAGGDRPWPTAPVLPRLKDVPAYSGTRRAGNIGDPALQSLLDAASDTDLARVLAVRMRRLLSASGLDANPELVRATDAALTGQPQPATDSDPAGKALRRIAWQAQQAGAYLSHPHRQGQPPGREHELRERMSLLGDADVVRMTLAGQYRQALVSDIHHQRQRDPEHWQAQADADLATIRRG
jgi:hypothetical protein